MADTSFNFKAFLVTLLNDKDGAKGSSDSHYGNMLNNDIREDAVSIKMPAKGASDSHSENMLNDIREDAVPTEMSSKLHKKSCPQYVELSAGNSLPKFPIKPIHQSSKHDPFAKFPVPQIPPNARVNIINADTINNLQIGGNMFSTSSSGNYPTPSYSKYNSRPITKSTRELTTKDLYLVARSIPEHWMQLGSEMNISREELKILRYDNHQLGLEETIVEMIKKWEMENPGVANASLLARLLKEIGRPDIACQIPD